MATYSIDLGINLAVTGTQPGTLTEPWPLQIGICQGELGPGGVFTPEKISSFRQLLSRDTLIIRTFDLTTETTRLTGTELLAPLFLRLSCRTPAGAATPDPWKVSGSPSFLVPAPEVSLCFASAAHHQYPCYRQVDTAGGDPAPVTYSVMDVAAPTTYLLRVLIAAGILSGKTYQNPYFGTDPEMVVGPYPGGG